MRIFPLRLGLLALAALVFPLAARAAEPEVVGGDWLTIDSVDVRGRAPFNPDALRQRYLQDGVVVPAVGESVRGTKPAAAEWKPATADEKGQVGGSFAMAYRAYESGSDRIVLADLARGGVLVVNGVPYVGDVYGGGFGPTPVALRKGTNHLFVRGVRGAFRLTFTEPEAALVLTGRDTTVPDLVAGERFGGGWSAVVVANCSAEWVRVVRVTSGAASDETVRSIPPLGLLKVPVPLGPHDASAEKNVTFPVSVEAVARGEDASRIVRGEISLQVREPGAARLVTFRSAIDGSVQEYGVRDATSPNAKGLILSVHGAGVGARGQANAYSAKDDTWVIAPTNRRPFGFDWQDWGRLDAYEVLADALAWTGASRESVCLTGHSMGGHGTWHLAANDPDGWAAIAPSAGWSQFDHYGGRPEQSSREPWNGADAASDTLALIDNLVQLPTYVLHGTADDNVPLSEAERMLTALRAAGGAPESHFQEGAGHWWNGDVSEGADCVDWPPIVDLFRSSRIAAAPRRIRWTTVDPAVDAEHHWVRVEQPLEYGRRVRVEGEWNPDDGSIRLVTENAGLMRVTWPGAGGLRVLTIDGVRLTLDAPRRALWVRRGGDAWWAVDGPEPGEKTADVSGPAKRGFTRGFVLVTGTTGTAEESAALLAQARQDACTWRYRGNGLAEVLRDVDAAAADLAGRNVVLYGNADTNGAWARFVGSDCPIDVRRGALRMGRQTWESGATAALFVRARADDAAAIVLCVADTGPAGTRLHGALLPFVSGVGYPDYAVFGPSILTAGDGGVLAAGWFDRAWQLVD